MNLQIPISDETLDLLRKQAELSGKDVNSLVAEAIERIIAEGTNQESPEQCSRRGWAKNLVRITPDFDEPIPGLEEYGA